MATHMSESREHYSLRAPQDPSPHDPCFISHQSPPMNMSASGRSQPTNGKIMKAGGPSSIKQAARFPSAFEVPRPTLECARNPPPHLTSDQHL